MIWIGIWIIISFLAACSQSTPPSRSTCPIVSCSCPVCPVKSIQQSSPSFNKDREKEINGKLEDVQRKLEELRPKDEN